MPTPRKSRMYRTESVELTENLWTTVKRVEAVGIALEASATKARKELEAVVAEAKLGLQVEVTALRNQVNKANRIIAQLLSERESDKTDYETLRDHSHLYRKE